MDLFRIYRGQTLWKQYSGVLCVRCGPSANGCRAVIDVEHRFVNGVWLAPSGLPVGVGFRGQGDKANFGRGIHDAESDSGGRHGPCGLKDDVLIRRPTRVAGYRAFVSGVRCRSPKMTPIKISRRELGRATGIALLLKATAGSRATRRRRAHRHRMVPRSAHAGRGAEPQDHRYAERIPR